MAVIITRHGGESHVMRPDGVMRSSIIRPFVGYNPSADAQAVAQAFTTGGPLATTLGGLRGNEGPVAVWWANVKARWANRKFTKQAIANAIVQSSPGPEDSMASQIAPQMQGQMQMVAFLTQSSNPMSVVGPVAQAGHMLSRRRWNTYFRAG